MRGGHQRQAVRPGRHECSINEYAGVVPGIFFSNRLPCRRMPVCAFIHYRSSVPKAPLRCCREYWPVPLPKERWAKPRQKRPFEDEERAVLACNTGRSATQNGTYRKTGGQRHACMGGKPAMKRHPATNPKWPWRPANRLCRLPSAAFFWRSNLADSGPDRILPHGKPTCRMARHWQKPLDLGAQMPGGG